MDNRVNRGRLCGTFASIATCVLCLLFQAPVHAATDVAPGTTLLLPTADGGTARCRRGATVQRRCESIFGETGARPAAGEVETKIDVGNTDIAGHVGIPLYSEAAIYNDIYIPGAPDNLVVVEVSVTYDFYGNFLAGGLYTLTNSLTLGIEDLSSPGEFAASLELDGMQRQGDQGLDIAVAQERAVQLGDSGRLQARLRRGHSYRISFLLQSSATTFLLGRLRADAFATLHSLSVSVAEDTTEQLTTHDQDMKEELATHDADVKRELADIKARLGNIEDDLAEIRQLLLTPQGLRPGFPAGKPPAKHAPVKKSAAARKAGKTAGTARRGMKR